MWNALRRLITANPMGIFIYGIITKWYLMIAVGAVVVTFWVFKGLEQAGVLTATEKVFSKALNDSKSVAKYCVPKIANLRDFWSCLDNPPDYTPEADEQTLTDSVNKLQQTLQNPYVNPAGGAGSSNPYDNDSGE
ncbi:DUF2670 domain-containing protein [Candidatus Trichorickettsia mobilis]|uniref:DUF2670 domain-containing protein n=1 Tax=Candidatus Trichorickettsia mobilis TaxID=1346319 RepID=A0ABZ0UY75_9RICK|nr:DUF2670 domain-containing protein [Candidatus Trichorickettsia mobilis]WPY01019.1 DUF2670 domain-containing protein [Candidatus Trichorickettsia mobilis]